MVASFDRSAEREIEVLDSVQQQAIVLLRVEAKRELLTNFLLRDVETGRPAPRISSISSLRLSSRTLVRCRLPAATRLALSCSIRELPRIPRTGSA